MSHPRNPKGRVHEVKLGIDLNELGSRDIEELADFLSNSLSRRLSRELGGKVDVDTVISIEKNDRLNLTLDLQILSPYEITPEVLSKVDYIIDKAIGEFEDELRRKCGRSE